MKRLSLLAAGALLYVGCTPRPTSTTIAAPARSPSRNNAIMQLWSVVDTIALNRPQVIARYGRPRAIIADTVRSFNDPSIVDSVVRYRYPLFELYYRVREDHQVELEHITIDTVSAGIPRYARAGTHRDSLVAWLGRPDQEEENFDDGKLLYYEVGPRNADELGNVFNIYVVNDRVRWVSWIFQPEKRWPR